MRYPGVGQRIRERLQILGYWKNDRPDVRRFCFEKTYLCQSMYGWLNGTVPSYENLMRLAFDLKTPPGFLLLGDVYNKIPQKRIGGTNVVPKLFALVEACCKLLIYGADARI